MSLFSRSGLYWVWRSGCVVDPKKFYASKTFPVIDGNGYYRGKMMPACWSTPIQMTGEDRKAAIKNYRETLGY